MTYTTVRIAGKCPACDSSTLFVGNGGYITCSLLGCPDPALASELLEMGRQSVAPKPRLAVFRDVNNERERQDAKFPMPDGFPPALRSEILMEEVGEAAKARLEWHCNDAPVAELRTELVQVAAVAVRWLEQLDVEAPPC